MNLGTRGLDLLKAKEECRLSVYLDQEGNPTIGWGHLILEGERFPDRISQERADALLVQDLEPAMLAVQQLVKVKLSQSMFDALVVLVFNIGRKQFLTSTTLRMVNARAWFQVPAAMQRFYKVTDPDTGRLVESRGLLIRRLQESALFLADPFPKE